MITYRTRNINVGFKRLLLGMTLGASGNMSPITCYYFVFDDLRDFQFANENWSPSGWDTVMDGGFPCQDWIFSKFRVVSGPHLPTIHRIYLIKRRNMVFGNVARAMSVVQFLSTDQASSPRYNDVLVRVQNLIIGAPDQAHNL
jgi:hypothetical protein